MSLSSYHLAISMSNFLKLEAILLKFPDTTLPTVWRGFTNINYSRVRLWSTQLPRPGVSWRLSLPPLHLHQKFLQTPKKKKLPVAKWQCHAMSRMAMPSFQMSPTFIFSTEAAAGAKRQHALAFQLGLMFSWAEVWMLEVHAAHNDNENEVPENHGIWPFPCIQGSKSIEGSKSIINDEWTLNWKHEASLRRASEAVIDDAVVTFDKTRNHPRLPSEKIPWTLWWESKSQRLMPHWSHCVMILTPMDLVILNLNHITMSPSPWAKLLLPEKFHFFSVPWDLRASTRRRRASPWQSDG